MKPDHVDKPTNPSSELREDDRFIHSADFNAFDQPAPIASVPVTPSLLGRAQISLSVGLITLLVLILTGAVVWGTLGLRTNGLFEDWSFFADLDRNGVSLPRLFTTFQPDRPFLTLIYMLGYLLTPNTFIGLQLLGLGTFIASGMALFGIVRELLPAQPVIAFMTAILFGVYPADTSLPNSRYYSYNLSVLAFLIAVWLLLIYWRRPRWWLIPGMWGALLICLGTYETAYPLVFLTPALLIWLNRSLSRRIWRLAVIWLIVPILTLIATLIVLSGSGVTYQRQILDTHLAAPLVQIGDYISYEAHAYDRMFIQGWTDLIHLFALHAIPYVTGAALLCLPVGLISGLIVRQLVWRAPTADNAIALPKRSTRLIDLIRQRRDWLILFAIGFAVIGLGFLTYLPTNLHYLLTDRVYLFSSIGGVLCVSLILYGVASLTRRYAALVLSILFAILFAIASAGAIGRAIGLRYDAGQEQQFLAQIAAQMPNVPDGTPIVIFDDSMTLQSIDIWRFGTMWHHGELTAAVQYLYHQSNLQVHICYPDPALWAETESQCTLAADGLHFSQNGETFLHSYDTLIAFRFQPGNQLTLLSRLPDAYKTADNANVLARYNPAAVIVPNTDGNRVPPSRVYTVLENWPLTPFMPQSLFPQRTIALTLSDVNATHVGETFVFPFLSDGWAGSWAMATTASLHVLLAGGSDYHLTFHVLGSMTPAILNSLTFQLNGQLVPLSRTDDSRGSTFTGLIPAAAVDRNPIDTFIVFHTDRVVSPKSIGMSDVVRALGVNIDWLHIDPAGQ